MNTVQPFDHDSEFDSLLDYTPVNQVFDQLALDEVCKDSDWSVHFTSLTAREDELMLDLTGCIDSCL